MERSVQISGREEEGQHTNNNSAKARRVPNWRLEWNPTAHADDKEEDDTELHKLARAQASEPADTDDDIDFTVEESRNAVASMDNKKAPGEDGITGEVYKSAFEVFPLIYNCIVQRLTAKRRLPEAMEDCKTDTHTETRKGKQRRGLQIPPHKSSQHRRESVRETAYK